jgi:hypothetical protein
MLLRRDTLREAYNVNRIVLLTVGILAGIVWKLPFTKCQIPFLKHLSNVHSSVIYSSGDLLFDTLEPPINLHIIFKDSVRTSQKTFLISITETSQWMAYREKIFTSVRKIAKSDY